MCKIIFNFSSCYRDNDSGEVRVYPGKLQVNMPYCTVKVNAQTSITDLIKEALKQFGLENLHSEDFRLSEILLDRGGKLPILFHSFYIEKYVPSSLL